MNLSTGGKPEKEESAEERQGQRSLKRYLLEKMQAWINSLLEVERDEFLGRSRYEPLGDKDDNYRNGYRARRINFFGLGEMELRVPRDGKGNSSRNGCRSGKGRTRNWRVS